MARTALIVPVPAADPIVGELRRLLDPSTARGVPAHVTLIVPFLPLARLDLVTRDELRGLFSRAPAFGFALSRIEEFPGAIYLSPEPAQPFRDLIEALVARYPEAPPYGGAYETVVPHLTVAMPGGAGPRAQVEERVAASLPIEARADEVHLLIEGEDGCWRLDGRWPLG